MKTLGVIGGLGPLATAYFMELIVDITKAHRDQDHIDSIIYSRPSIPDRTSYILNKSTKSPVEKMVDIGRRLEEQGAELIAIPCITAHSFYEELSSEINLPIVNVLQELALYLRDNNIKKVGILATDGTLYSKSLQNTLEASGIEVVLPSDRAQSYVMDIIYNNLKVGEPVDMEKFSYIKEDLISRRAEIIILGCTELSLLKRQKITGPGFIDPMEVLARRAVELCGGSIREEFKSLITK